jgi:hypothetical protein
MPTPSSKPRPRCETGWLEGNVKVYLWGMVTSRVTIFMIRSTPCRETATSCSDRSQGR